MPRFDMVWREDRNGHRSDGPKARPNGAAARADDGSSTVERPSRYPPDPKTAASTGHTTRRHPADRTSARPSDRVSPSEEPAVPPPLASLRSTRRPDDPADPMAALHSLQEQLAWLGDARRRPRRPRRPVTNPTERSERR
jgi:hypothetical protein